MCMYSKASRYTPSAYTICQLYLSKAGAGWQKRNQIQCQFMPDTWNHFLSWPLAHKVVACVFTIILITSMVLMITQLSTPRDEALLKVKALWVFGAPAPVWHTVRRDTCFFSVNKQSVVSGSKNRVTPGRQNSIAVWQASAQNWLR